CMSVIRNRGLISDIVRRRRCASRRHWGAGNSSPPPAIPSGGAARSMGLDSSPSDERSRARQDNASLGELAGQRIDLYTSRMLLDDDVVSDGQAEAGTLSRRLRCEEGIEHLLLYLGRNADAVITDPDLYEVTEVLRRAGEGGLISLAVVLLFTFTRRIEAV